MNIVIGKHTDVVSQTGNVTSKVIKSEHSPDYTQWESFFHIKDFHSIKLYGLNYYIEQFNTKVSDKDLDNLLYGTEITYDEPLQIVTVRGKITADKTLSDYHDALDSVLKSIQAPIIPRLEDICHDDDRYIDFGYCHGHYLEHDILVTRTHFILTADLHNWNKTVEDIVERFDNDMECKVYQITRTFNVYTEQGILIAFEIKIPENMLDFDVVLLDHNIKQIALTFSHL